MVNRLFIFISIHILLLTVPGYSQYISNPSFEGTTGMSMLPSGWTVCDTFSTPDTGPTTAINNTYTASAGSSYIILISRGTISPYAYHTEDCETQLLQPLLKDKCYTFKIDMANSKYYGHTYGWGDWLSYANPVAVKIYGENYSCDKMQLIAQFDSILNEQWQTYEFQFKPVLSDFNYLLIRAEYARPNIYFGNVELDNIIISNISHPDVTLMDSTINYGDVITLNASNGIQYNWTPDSGLSCTNCQSPTLSNVPFTTTYTATVTSDTMCGSYQEYFIVRVRPFIPNLISPNGDGFNDEFKIRGLEQGSSIVITDRWGKKLYESDNYDNSWDGMYDGKLLPPDTYWYVLKCPSIKESFKGFIYLKL